MIKIYDLIKLTKEQSFSICKSRPNLIKDFSTKFPSYLREKNPWGDPNKYTAYFKAPAGTIGVLTFLYLKGTLATTRAALFNPVTKRVASSVGVDCSNTQDLTLDITPEERAPLLPTYKEFLLHKFTLPSQDASNLEVIQKLSEYGV